MADPFADLQSRLMAAWSLESSSLWCADIPARGQCNPTALVVHDLMGGELLKTTTPQGIHYYNRIDGRRRDFTASQFTSPPDYEDLPATRDEIMAGTSNAQYEALRARLGIAESGTPAVQG
ncbi:MAG: YunG family protein [Rhizobiaceae bacterium]